MRNLPSSFDLRSFFRDIGVFERIRREVIQMAVVQLEDSRARVLGVVLNKRKNPIPRHYTSCFWDLDMWEFVR